tara:strand:- start:273 stop:716 length:444 start_codon:yes stop_codon:yes gene_type:complete
MKKLLGILVLGLLFCNNVNAEQIHLLNCKSNFWDHPFWGISLDLQNKKGAELIRQTDGAEERNLIYITARKGDVVYGYSIPAMMINEYVFNLNDNSFTRVQLTATATSEQRERFPKTEEFEEATKMIDMITDVSMPIEKQKCERVKP